MIEDLKSSIEDWDNRSTAPLLVIYQQFHNVDNYVEQLITLLDENKYQNAASWLLKHSCEAAKGLGSSQSQRVLNKLSSLHHWQAKLHILQLLSKVTIDEQWVHKLLIFLRNNMTHENKMVRAWCYNGWYVLAMQHTAFKAEARELFDLAMKDESASVKARIRNILKVF